MQLKQTLVGAIVGGVLGAALLVAAFFLFGWEHTALAVLVAFLVGLGVRVAVTTRGHASYIRGAMTALLALAAFLGGKFFVAEIAARQSVAASKPPVITAPPAARDAVTTGDEQASTDEVADAESTAAEPGQPTADANQGNASQQIEVAEQSRDVPAGAPAPAPPGRGYVFSTGDFIWLVVAALIAYELGRGSGTALPVNSTSTSAATTV